jgi:uncharacterized membrane protein
MNSKLSMGMWGLAAFLSAGVAGYAYWAVSAGGPPAPEVVANLFARPWLMVHMALAGTALLVGPLQLLPALRRRRVLHRWLGRTYVVGCLAGGVAGLLMAFGTTAGPVAAWGFGSLGVAWLITSIEGWRMARARRFDAHRAWMIRSFSLTFGAVMLRVYLPLSQVMGIEFSTAYTVIAWLAWVPNFLLAEAYLRGWFTRRASVAA